MVTNAVGGTPVATRESSWGMVKVLYQ